MMDASQTSKFTITLEIMDSGEKIQIHDHKSYTLGRTEPQKQSDELIDRYPDQTIIDLTPYNAYESGVSRNHARLFFDNSQLWIEDLNSSNGTRINGKDAIKQTRMRLSDGDILTLGRLKIKIHFRIDNNPISDDGELNE